MGSAEGADGERKAMSQWLKKERRLNKSVKKRKSVQQLKRAHLSPTAGSFQPPIVAKEARAALFAEWLIRQFGERLMRGHNDDTAEAAGTRTGTQVAEWNRRSAHSLFIFPSLLDPSASHRPTTVGVVDVAGGKGHLAYLLSSVYHIPTSVIEPRPLNLTRYQAQYHQRLQHMRQRQADSAAPSNTAVPLTDGCHLITHFRCYFPESRHVTHIPHKGTSSSPLYPDPPPPPPASVALHSQQPTVHLFVDPSLSSPLSADCPSVPLLHSYLCAATLLIGLHADGATEAIVDFALLHNKPFAVVPCCVFCNESGERIVQDTVNEHGDGQDRAVRRRVRSYEDFIAYLLSKDARIRTHTLPFQGRNLCLYVPPDR